MPADYLSTKIVPQQIRPATRPALSARYSAFGGVLHSDIHFPELAVAGHKSSANWRLRVDYGAPPLYSVTALGEKAIGGECYRLFSFSDGFRLVYSHAGTFDISADGKGITWYHNENALPELVRNIILGPAIALALEITGFFCLHGSAVAIDEAVIAFVGPKHFGKSTLATAFTTAGARLVSDDLLVVQPGSPVVVQPGVGSVRLWSDIAAALPLRGVCDTLIAGVKTTATGFAGTALATRSMPLTAIYLLSPVPKDLADGDASRKPLSPSDAAMALALQAKLPASLVGLVRAACQLKAAAAVAATVPVWTLHSIRDITRLHGVVRQITEWSLTP